MRPKVADAEIFVILTLTNRQVFRMKTQTNTFLNLCLPLVLFISLIPGLRLEAAFETFTDADAHARSVANANTAAALGTSAVSGNPALLGKADRIRLVASFMPRGLGAGESQTFLLNLSSTAVLPLSNWGGLGFSYQGFLNRVGDETFYSEYRFSLAGGVSFFKRIFSLGISGMIEGTEVKLLAPGSEGATPSGPFFNFNAGLQIQLLPVFGFGLALLQPLEHSTPGQTFFYPRLRTGAAYTRKNWKALLDVEYQTFSESLSLKPGAEWYLANNRIRLGAGLELQFLGNLFQPIPSAGIGFVLGRLHLEYALAYPIATGGLGNHAFTAGLVF